MWVTAGLGSPPKESEHCRAAPGNDTRITITAPREDTVGLLVMIVGLILFLGVHTLTTQRGVRAQCIAAIGEGGYKIAYALASLAGLVLIVWGFAHYRADGMIPVWSPP